MITFRLRLLSDLISLMRDVKTRPTDNLNHLYAHFYDKSGKLITDDLYAIDALEYLNEDIYHFEDFDLTNAYRVELHSH